MNRYSLIGGAAVTALALAGAAACSSSSNGAAAAPTTAATMPAMPSTAGAPVASAADTVTISGFAFSGPLTVAPGATVTVLNKDSVEHTVTADSSGGFDVTVPANGSTTFKAPTAPGTYMYHCSVHPSMAHAKLIVSG